jgi:hypothetical protein
MVWMGGRQGLDWVYRVLISAPVGERVSMRVLGLCIALSICFV